MRKMRMGSSGKGIRGKNKESMIGKKEYLAKMREKGLGRKYM